MGDNSGIVVLVFSAMALAFGFYLGSCHSTVSASEIKTCAALCASNSGVKHLTPDGTCVCTNGAEFDMRKSRVAEEP